jgi:hypothetical protein
MTRTMYVYVLFSVTSNLLLLQICRYIGATIKRTREFQTEKTCILTHQHVLLLSESMTMTLLLIPISILLPQLLGLVHHLQHPLAFCHQLRVSGIVQFSFCLLRKSVPDQQKAVQAVRVQILYSRLVTHCHSHQPIIEQK